MTTTETTDDGRLVLAEDYEGLCHTASEWHSGQWSAFYALASTGTITVGLAAEARQCLRAIDNTSWPDGAPDDAANLEAIAALEDLLPTDD